MSNILFFPRLATHLPWADIILQNFEQAQEHRAIELERRDPATDECMRWLRESHARRMLAHEERQAVMLRAVMGVA